MNKIFLIVFFFFFITFEIKAQKLLTIEEVNKVVMIQSNKIKIINNNFKKTNIETSFYKISLLPKVFTSITLPYQRSITGVVQPDGKEEFIERNFLNSALNLTVSQALPFTGGTLNLSSSMNNSRDFNNNISSFSSNWVNISYQQNINGFNSFKWNKKLNPLNFKKDSIDYLKEKIKLKYEISKLYLDTQLIQLKIDLLKASILKTEKIKVEVVEKLKYGRIIKMEVEQTKITLEQLKKQLEVSTLEFLLGVKSLKNMMNDESDTVFILKEIEQTDFIIDKEELKKTIKNNEFDLNKTIKLLESESMIDKVKKEGAISVNLNLGIGLNSSSDDFSNLYEMPSQTQFLTIGTKIPILDWGKSKKNNDLAKLEKENIELNLLEDEKKIDEQIENMSNYKLSLTSQINSLNEQLKLSETINEMFDELLKMGRKTISEYKTQLVETFNINMEKQKTLNNLYLLKLKINEINLTL
jgi:outer membrane protein TolC